MLLLIYFFHSQTHKFAFWCIRAMVGHLHACHSLLIVNLRYIFINAWVKSKNKCVWELIELLADIGITPGLNRTTVVSAYCHIEDVRDRGFQPKVSATYIGLFILTCYFVFYLCVIRTKVDHQCKNALLHPTLKRHCTSGRSISKEWKGKSKWNKDSDEDHLRLASLFLGHKQKLFLVSKHCLFMKKGKLFCW